MKKVERFINEDGLVGVVVSPGYGAGLFGNGCWIDSPEDYEAYALALDKDIVEAVINHNEYRFLEVLSNKFNISYAYVGGFSDAVVEFIEPGTMFYINDYDGFETLIKLDYSSYATA